MGIDGAGTRGWKALQKGAREQLFCETCEQHFNEHFEKPFRSQWIDKSPIPKVWEPDAIHWATFDYSSFKLFHLSVLFRAGVSSLPTFAEVSLGPHEERLRALILARDPGTYSQYPIFGYAVVHHETRTVVPLISRAEPSVFEGHRCYGMIYGGVHWWICVSSHRNREFERIGLQPDGRMPFTAVPWTELAVIQSAADALRKADPKRTRGVTANTA